MAQLQSRREWYFSRRVGEYVWIALNLRTYVMLKRSMHPPPQIDIVCSSNDYNHSAPNSNHDDNICSHYVDTWFRIHGPPKHISSFICVFRERHTFCVMSYVSPSKTSLPCGVTKQTKQNAALAHTYGLVVTIESTIALRYHGGGEIEFC